MFALIVIVMLSGTLKKTTTKKNSTLFSLLTCRDTVSTLLPWRKNLSVFAWFAQEEVGRDAVCTGPRDSPQRNTHLSCNALCSSLRIRTRAHTHTLFQQTEYWQGATESEILPCPLACFPALPGYSDAHRHARMQAHALCFSVQPTILLRSSLTLCLKVCCFLFLFFHFLFPFWLNF